MAVTLYYNEFSSPSRKCLMALYEKNVDFTAHHVDLVGKKEQYDREYLKMNPKGTVPLLKHDQVTVCESTDILRYINTHFDRPNQLVPSNEKLAQINARFVQLLDDIPTFPLTYGAAVFHTEHVTEILRWPYNNQDLRTNLRKYVYEFPAFLAQKAAENADLEAGRVLAHKAEGLTDVMAIFGNLQLYYGLLDKVEAVLDQVELELASEEHLGPWLGGPSFTMADIALTALLMRLYQIGLDQTMWMDGKRPHISVYQQMAFERASVKKATSWKEHKQEYLKVDKYEDPHEAGVNAAALGLGLAVVVGAAYTLRKLFK